uniref:Amino acid permease n=1 Tax=Thermosporothrix sp. COM3 TaxID=2490863 RepID=A0A455SGD2_9CHLR|nr:amino acid permease [Thermosporothrix sp. COM3]
MAQIHTPERAQPLYSEEYTRKVMPPVLTTFGMTATYLVIIFFIVNAAIAASGGASAFTYLLLGAITFFIPCAIATAQLAHMFPHEGSLYNWTHHTLGGYWSFFVGFCSWMPASLVMVSASDTVITLLQGLHSDWLTEPWQQGLILICILLLSAFLAMQRLKMVQYLINGAVLLIFVAVFLVGISGPIWLLTGHASATNFADPSQWAINWDPAHGNINLFGLVTLAYLGTEVPLNMAGEVREQKAITRHLFWGTLLVIVFYLIATASLLIVQGAEAGAVGGFSLISTVQTVLGSWAGTIVALCIMVYFIVIVVAYNHSFSRLLFVGGVDLRLPPKISFLNRHRVPARAIVLQTAASIIFTLIAFMVIPYIFSLSSPESLALEIYNISQASVTLIWAISTAFFFINLMLLYFRDKAAFHKKRIFPMWVLVLSSIVGPLACLVAIIDSLFFSWIPLISNAHWWLLVGGMTVFCLAIATIGSLFATSEASWQVLEKEV